MNRMNAEKVGIFPEGFDEAVRRLLDVLGTSPHSYAITVFRYEGETSYRAKVEITNFVFNREIHPGCGTMYSEHGMSWGPCGEVLPDGTHLLCTNCRPK